jgi:predicted AAA+ superfamily ATPase
MQLVFNLLRSRVGSPISYQSLAEDVAVSPTTIKKYVQILEALFIVFRDIARSLLKEPKLYFFDTGLVQGDDGAKLENFVAVSLLKHAYAKTDYRAEVSSLHYLRTKDGVEVDFALVCQDNVEHIIEVKLSDGVLSNALVSFQTKYHYPAIQLVKFLRNEYERDGIQVRSAEKFLSGLML